MENNDESSSFILREVTQEQRDAIKELFSQKGWELKEESGCKSDTSDGSSSSSEGTSNDESSSSDNDESVLDDYPPGLSIPPQEDEEECQHCFCRPCVTNERFRQSWWGQDPRLPSRFNSRIRKDTYKKFWTMLYHRYAWHDERYRTKKRQALRTHNRHEGWVGYHVRDIMPDCVLTLVRTWYPNLDKVPYMGHLWQ